MRVRIMYAKTAAGRFLSHLDLMHAWERAIRRTGAPLAFSAGFNPHPKLSFGSALSVGTTSDGEYMDVELAQPVEAADFRRRLAEALPPALALLDMAEIPARSESLMAMIDRARYQVTVTLAQAVNPEALAAAVEQLLALKEIKVLRFKKNSRDKREVDIRPGILALSGEVSGQREITLSLLVQTGSVGNVRPDEVVLGLAQTGLPVVEEIKRIHRLGLYVADGETLASPLVCGWRE